MDFVRCFFFIIFKFIFLLDGTKKVTVIFSKNPQYFFLLKKKSFISRVVHEFIFNDIHKEYN